MSKIRVDIHRDFACSCDELFCFLSEHESLGKLFAPAARFKRLSDGLTGRNTVGSAREITVLGVVKFVETYTKVEPGQCLEYTVSGRAPIKNHLSVMSITPTHQGCALRYTSSYDGRFPLAAFFITPGLRWVMQFGFHRLVKIMANARGSVGA